MLFSIREEQTLRTTIQRPLHLIIFAFLVVVTSIRCDFIDSAKEYFQGSKKKNVPTAAAVKAVPAQPQPNQAPVVLSPSSPNVLARVGNWTITTEEFNDRLNALKEAVPNFDTSSLEAKKLVLETLVRQQLLVQEAEKIGLANQKDIQAAVEEFRRTLIVQEVVKNMVRDIKISDEDAKAFYEEQKSVLIEPAQWHVREIVVDSQLRANELSVQLLQGADFAETAKQNSIGETAAQGGDLGTVAELPSPEMESALAPLNPGELSGVFKGPKGYYIVKLEEKNGGAPIPFEEIKQEIMDNQLMLKQQQVILDHVEKLKGQAQVEIKEGLLSAP